MAITQDPVSSAGSSGIVSPIKFAHVVLRTPHFRALVSWYKLVLNASPAFENEDVAFIAYDDEHHRVAFINVPGLEPYRTDTAGVHHIAFSHATLDALLTNYERLRERGIVPVWSVNHGPTTSLYYSDPDGNRVEFQVDNYDTVEEAGAFFFSDAFTANPIGVDFDPEELLRRLRAGEDSAALKLRPTTSGSRDMSSVPLP
ncbi:MAG TPA: VOC family protein [Sphingobium sp.]